MKMNRRHKVAISLMAAVIASVVTILGLNLFGHARPIERQLVHRYGIADQQMRRELGVLLGPPLIGGNKIDHFENGEQIFPAMLSAIRDARTSITFETYIYWSGQIGREFAEALAERARHGIKAHVMVDWLGSQKMDDRLLALMQDAHVEVEKFHPLRWYDLARINNRTHRKLLIVDGRVGFTGGVGIADQWNGHAQDPDHWRDSHFKVEGPAVAQLQAAFVANWVEATGKVLQGADYFPSIEPVKDVSAQLFTSSPNDGGNSMQLMYLLALTASEHTIDLSASYFVPDDFTRKALIDALHRKVRVRIIVPGKYIDTEVVRKASRASWGEILEAGAEIHEFQPTMFHCKMLVVDGLLVSVGSTNFDNRSFRLNDEANLNIYDRTFATQVTAVFERDLQRSRDVTLAQWRARPVRERALEKLATIFSTQL